MTDAPKVSVVVTCYNLGRYLDEAVDSILAQTFQDFEILIIDDGSTEPETVALLSSFQRPKTRVVHIENRGLSGARNEGIRRTSGPYVCAVDADDVLERTYFEKAVDVLDRDASVALVSPWIRTFGDEQWEWKPERADFPSLLDCNNVAQASVVRRDAIVTAGLFDETMREGCEDWDMWIRMVGRGFRAVVLREILFFYRRRRGSMSRVMMEGPTFLRLYGELIERNREYFELHAVELLMRREQDRIMNICECHDLELDYECSLRPEIERLRDRLRVDGRKLDRIRARTRREEAVAAQATTLAENQAQAILGLQEEVRALRTSLSWRLTRPLRAVYELFFARLP
jgi:glycosyltransferase involved in cell wall biosynthesis